MARFDVRLVIVDRGEPSEDGSYDEAEDSPKGWIIGSFPSEAEASRHLGNLADVLWEEHWPDEIAG